MHIFVAGATGVIQIRPIPLLIQEGHEVAGLTGSREKEHLIVDMGAGAVVGDAYDLDAMTKSMFILYLDLIIDQLTDLPDNASDIPSFSSANNRIRLEGTGNLPIASEKAGKPLFVVQSAAWKLPDSGNDAKEHMEQMVLRYGGKVFRHGQLYGPGTYYPDEKPHGSGIQVDEAAVMAVKFLNREESILDITDLPLLISNSKGGRKYKNICWRLPISFLRILMIRKSSLAL